jgi:hypothetical protein
VHSGSVVFFAVLAAAGLGAAYPANILRSLHLLVGLLFAGIATNAVGLEPGLWVAAVTGAVATWYSRGRFDLWRMVNGALVGFTGAAILGWLLSILVHATSFPAFGTVYAVAMAGFYSFGVSQTIWLDGVTWRRLDAIPSKRRIRNTLAPRYREPCYNAWHIDRVVARSRRIARLAKGSWRSRPGSTA